MTSVERINGKKLWLLQREGTPKFRVSSLSFPTLGRMQHLVKGQVAKASSGPFPLPFSISEG